MNSSTHSSVEGASSSRAGSIKSNKRVLDASGIVAGYSADLPILHGVDLHVCEGEIVTIIGPNGAGKSTFVKAIAGLVNITEGKVLLAEKDITHIGSHKLAASGVGFVPQTGNVFTTLTIHENLVLGGVTLAAKKAAVRIRQIYSMYPVLADRQHEKAGILSGGQRQILAVARALLTAPKLMLLDEPTAGLSPKAAAELFAVVRNLVADGASVLMVEQNARAALRISDRGYVLAEGLNRAQGTAQDLLHDNDIRQIFLGMRSEVNPPVNTASGNPVGSNASDSVSAGASNSASNSASSGPDNSANNEPDINTISTNSNTNINKDKN